MSGHCPTFGSQLRALRCAKGLTQAVLAANVGGISREAVSLWENDRTVPSTAHLFALAHVIGFDMARSPSQAAE